MRILVKNEVTTANNGIYVRTSATVLTRADDFDTPTEMAGGDFTFVTAGTVYDNTGWVMPDAVTTVGTSPVIWVQFSGAGTYTAGTGLTLTGSIFSITNTAVTAGAYGNGDRVTSFTVNGQGQLTAAANVVITANAANLSGTVLKSTVVTSSLTSVGTLGSLAVTGNISAGNVSATTFTGALTGAATTAGTVTTAAQGNITSVGTLSSLGVSGAVTASTLVSNVATGTAPLTVTSTTRVANLSVAYANVSDFISVAAGTGNNFLIFANAATGNITELTSTGLIANLSNNSITATTFVGALSGAATSATTAGTVTTAAQPNITSTGTLTSLAVTGNISAGNVSATTFTGALSGAATSATTAGTVTTAAQPNITSVGTLTSLAVTGNISAGNVSATTFTGALSGAATTAGTVTTAAQPNITSVGTLSSLSVTGNISAGNVSATTFTGALTGAATTAGTVTTAAQPNITSVGTLTSLAVTGNISAGNVSATNHTGTTANITGQYITTLAVGTAPFVVTSTTQVANLNVATAGVAGTVTSAAQPNITSVGTLASLQVFGTVSAVAFTANTGVFTGNGSGLTALNASNVSTGTLAQARLANASVTLGSTALTLGGTVTTVAGLTSVTSTTFVGALTGAATSATTAGTVTTNAQPNITSVSTSFTSLTFANAQTITGNNITFSTGANTRAGTFTGNFSLSAGSKLNATYADLAEKYVADAKYAPGTVLVFGGVHEVTLATEEDSTRVAGVVTTNPAYSMNSACEGEHVAEIALQGRVPVKVLGPVSKGDLLVSSANGHATANNIARAGTIIGKSLENFTGASGIIEVAVGRF
jgi:hypothetical protein